MTNKKPDMRRRKFLTMATSVVGGIGVGFAAIPFAGSWLPSAKAQSLGAPVEIDISKIEEGQKITVAWRGQPIFIIHRSKASLNSLKSLNNILRDPESNESQQPKSANNLFRSIQEKILVVVGLCTHLGCVPVYHPKPASLEPSWPGGFFCPCHGSKFDMSGRVYKGVPAPTNLPIPPHHYISKNILFVGEDSEQGVS